MHAQIQHKPEAALDIDKGRDAALLLDGSLLCVDSKGREFL